MLLNRDRRVFLGRRRSEAGPEHVSNGYAWQMPQGGIDPGEEPYGAALRELYEETNVRSVSLLAEAPDWYAYDLPAVVAGRAWKGRYRGQTQKWFAFRLRRRDRHQPARRRPPSAGIRRVALGQHGPAHRVDHSVQAPGLRKGGRGIRAPEPF